MQTKNIKMPASFCIRSIDKLFVYKDLIDTSYSVDKKILLQQILKLHTMKYTLYIKYRVFISCD